MSEFARPQRLDTIGTAPRAVTIAADDGERLALAARFGWLTLAALGADATLVRDGDAVRVDGRLRAQVVQACVASGAPVVAAIDEMFALRFRPGPAPAAEEVELDEAECDTLYFEGAAIDLGEAVAETLALALDPFPRAPDAEAALNEAGVLREDEAGPFGGLKALRDRLG